MNDLTNVERQQNKIPALTINSLLTKAAELKANDMATKGYFAHTSPEGKNPWYWFNQVGYDYQYAGENLAINFVDSKDVTDAWMESPTHRENIVKGKYTEIGTGIATGIFEGKETLFVAQLYASPSKLIPNNNNNEVISNIYTKKEPTNNLRIKKNNVLGAEITVNNLNKENNLLLNKNLISNTKNDFIILTPKPTFLQKIIASPHYTTSRIMFIILGVILLALILNIFIKVKHHHPDLITNGLITLAIIGLILISNNYLSKHKMVVLESLDFPSTNL